MYQPVTISAALGCYIGEGASFQPADAFNCTIALKNASNCWRFGWCPDLRWTAQALGVGDGELVDAILGAFQPRAHAPIDGLVAVYQFLWNAMAPRLGDLIKHPKRKIGDVARLFDAARTSHHDTESLTTLFRQHPNCPMRVLAASYVADAQIILAGWVEAYNRKNLRKFKQDNDEIDFEV